MIPTMGRPPGHASPLHQRSFREPNGPPNRQVTTDGDHYLLPTGIKNVPEPHDRSPILTDASAESRGLGPYAPVDVGFISPTPYAMPLIPDRRKDHQRAAHGRQDGRNPKSICRRAHGPDNPGKAARYQLTEAG